MTTRDPDRRPKHAAGDGEVPPWWRTLDRRRLAVALGSTFVAVPVVLLDNLPQREGARAEAEEKLVVTADAGDLPGSTRPPSETSITVQAMTAPPTSDDATTTTEAPATTVAPTTTEAPATTAPPPTAPPATAAPPTTARAATPATASAPGSPAVGAPAAATPTTVAPTAANAQSGKATWYRWRAGECAHKTLPRGTVVTVTNVANGRTASCTVTDRGPFLRGRIIDLDDDTFAQLAPLSSGVVDVTITW